MVPDLVPKEEFDIYKQIIKYVQMFLLFSHWKVDTYDQIMCSNISAL